MNYSQIINGLKATQGPSLNHFRPGLQSEEWPAIAAGGWVAAAGGWVAAAGGWVAAAVGWVTVAGG